MGGRDEAGREEGLCDEGEPLSGIRQGACGQISAGTPGQAPEAGRKNTRDKRAKTLGTQDTQCAVTGWPPRTQTTEPFFSVCFYL